MPGRSGPAALLFLLLAIAISTPGPAVACSLIGSHGVQRPDASHLIALPTGRMVSAPDALPPHLAEAAREPAERVRGWVGWKARLRLWWERVLDLFRPSLPYGQVVRVERFGGAEGERVRAALERSGGEAVLVRWTLRGDCGEALNPSREPWTRPGGRLFTTARLRAREGWVEGRPTLDVSSFDFPYPDRQPGHDDSGREVPGLRVADYWSLYEALPAHAVLRRDTAAALAPLRGWMRAHPQLARHPVARGELRQAESYAAFMASRSGSP